MMVDQEIGASEMFDIFTPELKTPLVERHENNQKPDLKVLHHAKSAANFKVPLVEEDEFDEQSIVVISVAGDEEMMNSIQKSVQEIIFEEEGEQDASVIIKETVMKEPRVDMIDHIHSERLYRKT